MRMIHKIEYTDSFKEKIREIFGNAFDEQMRLGHSLRKILDQNAKAYISPEDILLSSPEELKERAQKILKIRELYEEYWQQPGV